MLVPKTLGVLALGVGTVCGSACQSPAQPAAAAAPPQVLYELRISESLICRANPAPRPGIVFGPFFQFGEARVHVTRSSSVSETASGTTDETFVIVDDDLAQTTSCGHRLMVRFARQANGRLSGTLEGQWFFGTCFGGYYLGATGAITGTVDGQITTGLLDGSLRNGSWDRALGECRATDHGWTLSLVQ